MSSLPLSVVLAHQGGWDEMLMVAVPIAVLAVVLQRAGRRAKQAHLDDAGPTDPD